MTPSQPPPRTARRLTGPVPPATVCASKNTGTARNPFRRSRFGGRQRVRAEGGNKMGSYLSERELSELSPAETAAFPSPVPTQMVSNGEFNPLPQSADQRKVEGRLKAF